MAGSLDVKRFAFIEHYNNLINSTLPEDETERDIVLSVLDKYKIEHKSISRIIEKYGAWVDGCDARYRNQ